MGTFSPFVFFYFTQKIKFFPTVEPPKIIVPNPSICFVLALLFFSFYFILDFCLRVSLAFSYRIAHNTIAGITYNTCDAIWECLVEKHMPFPSAELLEKSGKDYEQLWNFPNCVASIDGKHTH